MPVQLPPVTDLAAQAASLLFRGDDAAALDVKRFAAQFEALLGKNFPDTGAAYPNPVSTLIDTARAADPELAADLAALLPFIEALGLTQAPPTEESPIDPASLATATLRLEDAAAALAVPQGNAVSAGTPAISAVNAPSTPQSPAAGSATQTSIHATAATEPTPVNLPAAGGMSPDTLPAGREFSAQLVAALAAGKETAQTSGTPGAVAATVHQVIAQASPAQVAPTRNDLDIMQPVGAPGWTEEIGNRIAWLASRSESRADLVLTPPQMGRVEISLSIKGDQAAASFASANPVVREALEAALPRLREVLAEAGIQLGQAQVSAENARQWAQQEKHGENFASDRDRETSGLAALSSVSSGSLSTVPGLKAGRGLVDVFA